SPTDARSNAARTASSSVSCGSTLTVISADSHRRGGLDDAARHRFPEARADPLRKHLEDILLGREIDELLRLHDFARDVFGAPEGVGQSELDALLPRPDEPG